MDCKEKFMKYAIGRAKTAAKHGETPVGAVIVKDGRVISGGRNRRETGKNALYHAEISAINSALVIFLPPTVATVSGKNAKACATGVPLG